MAIEFSFADEAKRDRASGFRYDLVGVYVLVTDIVLILAAGGLSGFAYGSFKGDSSNALPDSLALGALFATLVVMLAKLQGLYQPMQLLRPARQLSRILWTWVGVAGFLTSIAFALKAGHTVSRLATISFVVLGAAFLVAARLYWCRLIAVALERGAFATRTVAMIGMAGGAEPRRLSTFGMHVAARLRLTGEAGVDDHLIADAVSALRGAHVEEVVILQDGMSFERLDNLIARLRVLPLPIKLLLDTRTGDLVTRSVQRLGTFSAVEMRRSPMTPWERGIKRGFDVAIAATGLVLISPLLVMTALVIRIDSPGPILFRQTRNGFNCRPFKILKFRSMRVMEDGTHIRQASRDDDRVTRVGRWIRRLSIDELPQLWNVLRGEMSIVGPRPHALAHDERYEKLIGDYPYRQHVKPGLTGWAQINGSRGETPTIESMAERVRLDIWYVENLSIWLDLRIVVLTFVALLNVKHTY